MAHHPLLQPGACYHIYNRANGKENLFRHETNYTRFLELYEKYIFPVADTFAWVLMANHFHLLVQIKEGVYYRYSKEDFSSNADRSPAHAAGADAVGFEDVKWETMFIDPSGNPSASEGNPSASEGNPSASEGNPSASEGNPSASEGPDGIPASDGIPAFKKRKKANATHHFSHLFNAYAKYINEKYNRHGSLFQRPFRRKQVEDADYFKCIVLYIHNNPVHHRFVNHPSEYPWSSYHTFFSPEPTRLRRQMVLDWFDGIDRFREMHSNHFDHAATEAWLETDTGN
jgi:REP element-mobilizing transposase RayT